MMLGCFKSIFPHLSASIFDAIFPNSCNTEIGLIFHFSDQDPSSSLFGIIVIRLSSKRGVFFPSAALVSQEFPEVHLVPQEVAAYCCRYHHILLLYLFRSLKLLRVFPPLW